MIRVYLLVILQSWLTATVIAQQTNVLFVGNSYTHMNNLCKMYQNLANSKGKYVFADTLAVSGSTLEGHTLRANTYKKIKSRSWDYVFIQGFSRELSYDSATIAIRTIPYARQLVDSLKKYNPCLSIYFYMTWGYANGFTDSIPGDNYSLMQSRIERGYLQMSDSLGKLPVAPVGMVWNTFKSGFPEINLYAPDNAHPSPYGSYIAACTFYSSIYGESPIGGEIPKKVEEEIGASIQKVAYDFVQENRDKYFLDTVQITRVEPSIKEITVNEKWLSVHLSAKVDSCNYLLWEFGDGKTSSKKHVKHYYKEPGTYTIRLSVKNGCAWTRTSKKVRVSNKEKKGNTP